MANLLHLTYDLRSFNNLPVTPAVRNLISETKKIAEVRIIDLLRVIKLNDELVDISNKEHLIINSFGLPYGIFLLRNLNRAYKKIIDADKRYSLNLASTDIIHAHKVTFEGYIAYKLAVRYDTKLILTLRQTDTWVIKKRPDLIRHFKLAFERSNKIIFLIPSIIEVIKNRIGEGFFNEHIKNKLEFVPNIIEREIKHKNHFLPKGNFLTAMWMDKDTVERKNLKRLLHAVRLLNNPEFKLTIIGDGDYLPFVKKWVKQLELEDNVIFKGNIPNSEMDSYYSSSTAFLMPSLSESFGMVYAESILNGTPILYSRDCLGFHGIFQNIGPEVNPYSVISIKEGIEDLLNNNLFYRDTIKGLQDKGEFKIFSSGYVRNRYNEIIQSLA